MQTRLSLYGTVACVALITPLAFAQGRDALGSNAYFDVRQSLQYETNPTSSADNPEAKLSARTHLGFGWSSVTPAHSFSFNSTAGLKLVEDGENGLDTLNFNLAYSHITKNSSLSAQLKHSESDISRSVTLDDSEAASVDETVILDTGTRRDSQIQLGAEFGRQAKFGVSLNANQRFTRYDGLTHATLEDTDSRQLSASARFEIDPRITMRLSLSDQFRDTDTTERRTQSAGASLDLAVTPVLDVSASLSYSRNEYANQTNSTDTNGWGGGFSLKHDLRDGGAWRASFNTSENTAGRRNSVNLSRSFDLRNGNASFSIGATQIADDDVHPVISASYETETRRGRLNLSATHRGFTNNNDATGMRTRVAARYSMDVNSFSGISAGFGYSAVSYDDSSIAEQDRYDLNLSYRRNIGAEWDMVAGYNHISSHTNPGDSTSTNTVSLSVQKRFEWRP